jgi:RNA polymerase sigma factor (TIGR02999 family)
MKDFENGSPEDRASLFSALYDELRSMAQREVRRGAVTLSPTTLLHETYLNLSKRDALVFNNRNQFMAYAARSMRGLIVDYLRSRNRQKRGAEFEITSLPFELPHVTEEFADQIAELDKLNEAMESLSQIDARLAECVDLRFFCGFSIDEIARMWDVSERTVRRDWDKARALLNCLMKEQSK